MLEEESCKGVIPDLSPVPGCARCGEIDYAARQAQEFTGKVPEHIGIRMLIHQRTRHHAEAK